MEISQKVSTAAIWNFFQQTLAFLFNATAVISYIAACLTLLIDGGIYFYEQADALVEWLRINTWQAELLSAMWILKEALIILPIVAIGATMGWYVATSMWTLGDLIFNEKLQEELMSEMKKRLAK